MLLDVLGEEHAADLVEEWFPEGEDQQADDSEAALATAIGKLEAYLREVSA